MKRIVTIVLITGAIAGLVLYAGCPKPWPKTVIATPGKNPPPKAPVPKGVKH